MADSTDEVLPAGWAKKTSRSTGKYCCFFILIIGNKSIVAQIQRYCVWLVIGKLIWYFTGLHYYLNIYTKESQWELPTEPAKEDGNSRGGPNEVQCAHLLVKHSKSRRPSSWREENITRSKDEARAILEGYAKKVFRGGDPSGIGGHEWKAISNREILFQIKSGEATLAELAKEYSDCSSAKRGGDLGPFSRGTMQKPFEEVAFSLKVGEISDITETDSGLHIIERIK